MSNDIHQIVAALHDMFRPVLDVLGKLSSQLNEGNAGDTELENLLALLQTLPLSADDFSRAATHLKNAHRYIRANESGAARWELQALRRHLQKQEM